VLIFPAKPAIEGLQRGGGVCYLRANFKPVIYIGTCVASNNRSSGTAALRYASALVDLAIDAQAVPTVEKDVAELRAMIADSSDLQYVLSSPLLGLEEQSKALAAIADAAKFSPLVKNFLLTLSANRRAGETDAILKTVQETLAASRGELQAKVESAVALSDAQKKDLETTLGKTLGRPVALDVKVNKDLIGGLTVTLGSLMIDDSVKSKLERLSLAMKYTRDAA
jgi:F-type H+-transporting ATPase subunit delta